MKISELRAREHYDQNLMDTLKNCIRIDQKNGDRYGAPIQWFCHPFFSVYTSDDFCLFGRYYLRNQYLYTPNIMRRWIQAAAVEIMYQKKVFQNALIPAFELDAPENPNEIMWMPGNHRFRKFDFNQRTLRIYPKHGFSRDGILQEIQIRSEMTDKYSWILPMLKFDIEDSFIEEPLISAHPLNREPDKNRVSCALTHACKLLDELHTHQYQKLKTDEYIDIKRKEFVQAKNNLNQKFKGIVLTNVDEVFEKSVRILKRAESVDVSLTHGDFQPGNILIPDKKRDDIWLIDWEDASIRASVYDRMTYLLNSRSPYGLKKRVRSFLRNPDQYEIKPDFSPGIAIALWAIEEWIWLMNASCRQGITQLPAGLCQQFREISH